MRASYSNGCIALPGVFNALVAKLAERVGFEAIYLSGGALSAACGLPDIGLLSMSDFARQIRPLLSDRCFKCHGPSEKAREAGLRLDTQDGALSRLESESVAVVPGKSADSELYHRITAADADERMPPPETSPRPRPSPCPTGRES